MEKDIFKEYVVLTRGDGEFNDLINIWKTTSLEDIEKKDDGYWRTINDPVYGDIKTMDYAIKTIPELASLENKPISLEGLKLIEGIFNFILEKGEKIQIFYDIKIG